jgi:hypothetical protein
VFPFDEDNRLLDNDHVEGDLRPSREEGAESFGASMQDLPHAIGTETKNLRTNLKERNNHERYAKTHRNPGLAGTQGAL